MSSANIKELQAFEVVDKLHAAGLSSAKWRVLGQRLTPKTDLEAIKADHPTSSKECLEKVVDAFLRNGGDVSWEALAKAVAQCEGGGRNVARKLLTSVGIDPDELELLRAHSDNDEGVSNSDEDMEFQGAGNESLKEDSAFSGAGDTMDAKKVFEEIKEAKKKVFALGVKLNLPASTRKRINSTSLSPDERLLKTLEEYSKLINPKPSWEGIATALDDKFVGLPELANKIGETHCPGWKVVLKYENLKNSFEELISLTCKAIEDRGMDVDHVVDAIRGLPIARGERDKEYFMEFADHLRGSNGVPALFDRLCCNWDYLHPEIYRPLTRKLSLTNVEQITDDYLEKWAAFLNQTPLTAFCKIPDIELEKDKDPPPGFVQFVKKLNWEPPPKYLRDVDKLRRKFAKKCSLQSCVVTIVDLRLKCIVITMWVPKYVELYVARDMHFIEEQSILKMVFNGMIVYSQDSSEVGSSVDTVRKVQPSKLSVTMKFIAKQLFDKPVRRVQKYLKSPLTRAAQNGTVQEVRELIASGEDPNPHSVATPLKEACSRGDLEIARVLLEAGADPNLVTDEWTPLMEAARLGNREMIQLLVEFGANPNTTNHEKWTALMAASNNGRTEAVDQLLQFGSDPNMQDYVGWSAPLASVFKQHEEIALRLTEAGANPHLQNMEYRSPLRLAIEYKQYILVDAFLDTHPDVKPGLRGHPELDSKDKYGETDLLFACKENDIRVVEKILHKGADPNIPNLDEEVPLVAAAECGNTEMVVELLRAGADPNPNLTTLKSPLSVAAQSGNLKMVTELLHARANPNYFTDKGTPLANAAKLGNIEMVQSLLNAGADPNIAEYADQLPLHHARRLDNKQMIQLLLDYKADPERETKLPRKVAQLALGFLKGPLANYIYIAKIS